MVPLEVGGARSFIFLSIIFVIFVVYFLNHLRFCIMLELLQLNFTPGYDLHLENGLFLELFCMLYTAYLFSVSLTLQCTYLA